MGVHDLVEIGRIVRLQVQPAPLKVGRGAGARYDPSPLRAVPRLRLTRDGAVGLMADGREVGDVHHAGHPQSRCRGDNSLSVGFTEHYRQMRAQFGPHLTDGVSGESILVKTDRPWSREELAGDLFVLGEGAGARLTGVIVAAPCAPFARFASGDAATPPELKAAVQFLHNGRRGFYVTLAEPGVTTVAVGDRMYCARPADATPGGMAAGGATSEPRGAA